MRTYMSVRCAKMLQGAQCVAAWQDREFTWHGFCSTTKTIEVLSNPLFCGETGSRTIFVIQLTQGQAREITRYSLVPCEGEVLLPPGCRFVVRSVLPQGELTIIQIEELPSDEWILDLRADLPEGVPPHAGGGAAAAKQPEPQPQHANAGLDDEAALHVALAASAKQQAAKKAAVPKKAAVAKAMDPVAAMQAKYPELKECAALVKLGLTAADTVRRACLRACTHAYGAR